MKLVDENMLVNFEKCLILGNGTEWCESVYHDLNDSLHLFVNDFYMSKMNFFIKMSFKIKFSKRLRLFHNSKILNLIITNFYKKYISQYRRVLFFDWNPLAFDTQFLSFLKLNKKKIGIVFTNIFAKSGFVYFHKENILKKFYDLALLFDKKDTCQIPHKYYSYSYSTHYVINHLATEVDKTIFDVFFIGNAKNRFNDILNVYEKMINAGYKCCFIVNGVKKTQRIKNGIIYNKFLSYKDVVNISSKSRCILEILQDGGTTSTLRLMEAIALNKYFLTNNACLICDDLFDKQHMNILTNSFNYEDFLIKISKPLAYNSFYLKQISIDNFKNIIGGAW